MKPFADIRSSYARGAGLGLLIGAVAFWLIYLATEFLPHSVTNYILFSALSLGIAALVGGGLAALIRRIGRLPLIALWALAMILILFALALVAELPLAVGLLAGLVAFIVINAAFGVALTALAWRNEIGRGRRIVAGAVVVLAVVAAAGSVVWLSAAGAPARPITNAASQTVSPLPALAHNPTARGGFAVTEFSYGPASSAFPAPVPSSPKLVTASVDGRAWIANWSFIRQRYWGFGPDALPVRGRVWRPAGDGPFPLALVMHGNHAMETQSEQGYAYLCELLASRGIVCASVDANFLNASTWSGGMYLFDRGADVTPRAWLLLEHLREWRAWNRDADHPLAGLIDESRIALIGHSLGGEAAAVAAALNTLPAYPDDATRQFDYDFGIRAVVALAPTDSLTWLGGRRVRLANVDYLALHGSHDMDVMAFQGQNQLERVSWNDHQPHFGAAVYIYGANHGQFNTVWGRQDKSDLIFGMMNTAQIMPAEEQQALAGAYVSAFLEGTLNDNRAYLDFARDGRVLSAKLSDAVVLSQVHESSVTYIATYEEDVDVSTATLPGATISARGLLTWREALAPLKLDSVSSGVAYLGWDAARTGLAANYTVDLPASFKASPASTLVFALAHRARAAQGKIEPLDLTVELVDAAGNAARLPLSHFAYLQPELRAQLAKRAWMTATVPQSHPVFQTFNFPLADFEQVNPAFDAGTLRAIRFLFDRSPAGLVLLDELGVRPN